jgi:hypothetical protein
VCDRGVLLWNGEEMLLCWKKRGDGIYIFGAASLSKIWSCEFLNAAGKQTKRHRFFCKNGTIHSAGELVKGRRDLYR